MLRPLMMTKSRNVMLLGMGLVIGLSLGIASGVFADKPAALKSDLPWQDARMLADVLERVKHDYVNPVDDHQLLQAAIRGMVASLDPYSAYLDGDEEDEEVVVVSPFEGSPAAAAGIRSGDVIVTIDGVPVNTTTLADTIGRMRGKEGTSVKIGILRQGSTEPK